MARLFTCGFEEGNLLAAMWTTWGGNVPTIGFTGAPSGSCLMNTSATAGNSFVSKTLAANKSSGSLWTRFKWSADDATPSANTDIISDVSSGSVVTMQVRLLTSGVWSVFNALTTTEVTTTATAANDTVYRIETYHLLDTGTNNGDMKVRIYNNTTGVLIEEIGLPTLETTKSTNVLTFRLGKTGSTSIFSYDDFAINDDTGSFQNTWAGDGRVALMTPAVNNVVTWGPTTPTGTNSSNVDDTSGPFVFSNFNGSSMYLTFADLAAHDLTAAGAFTIAAVVRARVVTGNHYAVSHSHAANAFGWRFGVEAGHLEMRAWGQWGDFGTATTDLTANVWYGIAATRPASSANVTFWRFRLDSQTMASQVVAMANSNYSDGAVGGVIGGSNSTTVSSVWDGQIARVGIDVGTEHTQQELTDFFNGSSTTSWDSRWDLPSLTDTGTAGATLTNVGTLSNDTSYNADSGTSNEDRITLTDLPAAVPSNATLTLMDAYARVSASGSSGTMALVLWDELSTRTQGPTMTVSSTTWRILTTDEHQVLSLAGKTKANTDFYNIGYKALSGGVEKRITAVWANVEYTEPSGTVGISGSAVTSSRGTSVPGIEVPL